MRVCILKQPYATSSFTWSSRRWSNPATILSDFVFRSQNFGLVCETQADIWVLEDGDYIAEVYADLLVRDPQAVESLYAAHTVSKWSDVPWKEYDVVISMDAIAPSSLISQYPKILWCYYENEHTFRSFAVSAKKPQGKYDLFLNHAFSSPAFAAGRLPASVNFPYLVSRTAFHQVIHSEKCDSVYLDSHCIRNVPDLKVFRAELKKKFGMEVEHSKPWNFARSCAGVAGKEGFSAKEYLTKLASCKYFLLNRRGEEIGQAVPEAAALDVIVLATRKQIYSPFICHPETFIEPLDYDSAAEVIHRIQANPELQSEILEFQRNRIKNFFLDQPLKILQYYFDLKQGKKTSFPVSRTAFKTPVQTSPLKLARKCAVKIRKKLSETRADFSFYIKTRLSRGGRCKKLSIVFAGRNDDYGGTFKERVRAALKRNQKETQGKNFEVEWIFVEWNPLSEDYFSYELAELGVHCYVVDPSIHKNTVNPLAAGRMSFMQALSENAGIRRATGDWILITNSDCVMDGEIWDYISTQKMVPEILYRAERQDVDPKYFNEPFEVIRKKVVRINSFQWGLTAAAGDFLLIASRYRLGYDEDITFVNYRMDSRFCMNWSSLRGGGEIRFKNFLFRNIGRIYKAAHPLMIARTLNENSYDERCRSWNCYQKFRDVYGLYCNREDWGFIKEPQKKIAENIWYIGSAEGKEEAEWKFPR